MPYPELKGLLTDIGTEELGHLEMIAAIVHQLTRKMTPEEIKRPDLKHTSLITPPEYTLSLRLAHRGLQLLCR